MTGLETPIGPINGTIIPKVPNVLLVGLYSELSKGLVQKSALTVAGLGNLLCTKYLPLFKRLNYTALHNLLKQYSLLH